MPATPAGIQAMFVHYGIDIAGKHVVIVGPRPDARPAAVAAAHAQAAGRQRRGHRRPHRRARHGRLHPRGRRRRGGGRRRPSIVTPDMVRPGAVVVSGGVSWEGRKLLPDVDEAVGEVASWITPRLGGVGPTTVAMLLRNTVEAAERPAKGERLDRTLGPTWVVLDALGLMTTRHVVRSRRRRFIEERTHDHRASGPEDLRPAGRRSDAQLRVLPAEDRRGRAPAREGHPRAGAAATRRSCR